MNRGQNQLHGMRHKLRVFRCFVGAIVMMVLYLAFILFVPTSLIYISTMLGWHGATGFTGAVELVVVLGLALGVFFLVDRSGLLVRVARLICFSRATRQQIALKDADYTKDD